jgi:hypothetical protein
MNLDDFAPQPDFFPYFPVWQGNAVTLQTVWKHWLRRRRLYQSALMC